MDINRANRQVADVLIQEKKTKALFLDFKTANTTTTNISADSVYARAKGANRIAFPNSPEGTLTIEAQVYPFKMFALFSDGKIDTTAVYGEIKADSGWTDIFITPGYQFKVVEAFSTNFCANICAFCLLYFIP